LAATFATLSVMNVPVPNPGPISGYDRRQTYDWNFHHAPDPVSHVETPIPGHWEYCGRRVASPLGIAAGPLLNGRWIRYYAARGFDVLTYKTVRSRARPSYPLPNLQPVSAGPLNPGSALEAAQDMQGSWAVSFGMPSQPPDYWRRDIECTRRALPSHKLLAVSVVATPEPDWTLEDVADDFARCARWAADSGADFIEANFSCPNVASADAQLYQQPEAAALVAARVRAGIGALPLLIKIGHVTDSRLALALAQAVAPQAQALVMVNCISALVVDERQPLFNGEKRGIAGDAIREAAVAQVRLFSGVIREAGLGLKLVGVGGIATAAHVRAQLDAGSHAVQLATAPMLDPNVGLSIRGRISESVNQ